MTTTGYILTGTGAQALAAFELDCVRYAAQMKDGTGFLAFDGIEGLELEALGKIMEPIPEYPDTWPQPQRIGPKRKVSNGMERFYIVSDLLANDIMNDAYSNKHVTGIVMLADGNVLIETDGFVVPMAIWVGNPTVMVDKRLLVPTA